MGGGNGQKAKMARERNLEKQKGAKGSQLEANKKAMNIQIVGSFFLIDSRVSHFHNHMDEYKIVSFTEDAFVVQYLCSVCFIP
ncbi:hypothetical protein Dsin_003135 [Dipteronia sinensis]|uniref:Small EDRK-rich factor-like N-terminal domain-containing protein n=1 Tax=Dipteronia sinensis TaxID=43782 RepID=A0AAE0B8E9_9ROSI|nr:hypothetical protein Dsin_003135 [Dipteronia sinensis]